MTRLLPLILLACIGCSASRTDFVVIKPDGTRIEAHDLRGQFLQDTDVVVQMEGVGSLEAKRKAKGVGLLSKLIGLIPGLF